MKKTSPIIYNLVDYHLNVLTDMLMSHYGLTYDEALLTVMSSDTYKRIAETGVLQGESPLYAYSILDNELKDVGIVIG